MVDHKDIKPVQTGEELVLDLHTHQAEQVIFQNNDESDWTVLWKKDAVINMKSYLEKRDNKLILRNVTVRSTGTYKVLDSEGLALSTVKVTVTGRSLLMSIMYCQKSNFCFVIQILFSKTLTLHKIIISMLYFVVKVYVMSPLE